MQQQKLDTVEPPVLDALEDGVLTITLNRPGKLNALNVALHAKLRAAFERARDDAQCRVVLLRGAGRGFCSGQDLSDRLVGADAPPPDIRASIETNYNPLITLIRTLPKPVIAAVHGVAAGAGANLALACDIVLATTSATFIQAFSKIGLIPDSGGTWALPRLVGEARARALTMLAEPLSGEQAAAWGMIWKAVDDEAFEIEVQALAKRLSTAPTYGLALTKQALLAAGGHTLEQQLALECDLQVKAGASPDFKEGVSAFIEKRKPNYTGRAQ